MYRTKLNKIGNLIEKIKNDITLPLISDFLDWFLEKLEIHFNKNTPNLKYQKGDIYFINLGKNIGSELNKTRPCIVYSKRTYNNKNSIIIIPLKSLKNKNFINKFHIKISKSSYNNLNKGSLCDIFHIKNISTKRINRYIGKIEQKYLDEIDFKIQKMFGIKNKE